MLNKYITKLILSKPQRNILLAVLIGFTIWLPRGFELDRFVSTDEAIWVFRSGNFFYSLWQKDFANSYVNSSPGVVTLWVDTAGFLIEFPEYRGLGQGYFQEYFQFEDYLFSKNVHPREILFASRYVMVMVHTIITTLSFFIAWKLFGKNSAILGFLLIAFDPYYIGNSRLSHLDGPLTAFLFLSLLSLLVYLYKKPDLIFLAISSFSGSVALMAKVSGLLMLPTTGIFFLFAYFREFRDGKYLLPNSTKNNILGIMKSAILWAGFYIISLFIFWPAFWSSESRNWAINSIFVIPLKLAMNSLADNSTESVFVSILGIVSRAFSQNSLVFLFLTILFLLISPTILVLVIQYFYNKTTKYQKVRQFAGEAGIVVLIVGLLYLLLISGYQLPFLLRYPIAFLWRSTPIVLIGLLLSIFAIHKSTGVYSSRVIRYAAIDILLFTLLYTIILTIPSKWAEDYYLPVYPIFDLIAGLGWVSLISMGNGRWKIIQFKWVTGIIALVVIGFQMFFSLRTFPYYLSYYNPLLGGGSGANGKLFMGVGEGLDQVGRYLNEKPHADELNILSWYGNACLSYYFDGNVRSISHLQDYSRKTLQNSDYLVTYTNQWFRNHPETMMRLLEGVEPEHTIWINGVEYARIYDVTTLPPEMFEPK